VSSNSSAQGGIGIGGVLFVVFLVLKLCHVISWSWWWVTCPLWTPLAIVLLFMVLAVVMAVVTGQLCRSRSLR